MTFIVEFALELLTLGIFYAKIVFFFSPTTFAVLGHRRRMRPWGFLHLAHTSNRHTAAGGLTLPPRGPLCI